eukprot:1821058-Lingulodinium_polyedra.AAC.1
MKLAFAEIVWNKAKEVEAVALLWVAGFPCRGVSSVNLHRRGFRAVETARFEVARLLFEAVVKQRPPGAVQ